MNRTITVTSKGQTTIPADLRQKLSLNQLGGKLQAHFNDETGELIVTKPLKAEDLSNRIGRFIKPGTKPVADVDAYYQKNRIIER